MPRSSVREINDAAAAYRVAYCKYPKMKKSAKAINTPGSIRFGPEAIAPLVNESPAPAATR